MPPVDESHSMVSNSALPELIEVICLSAFGAKNVSMNLLLVTVSILSSWPPSAAPAIRLFPSSKKLSRSLTQCRNSFLVSTFDLFNGGIC